MLTTLNMQLLQPWALSLTPCYFTCFILCLGQFYITLHLANSWLQSRCHLTPMTKSLWDGPREPLFLVFVPRETPFLGVWAGPSALLLTNKIWQKQWDATHETRLQKDSGFFCLGPPLFFPYSYSLCLRTLAPSVERGLVVRSPMERPTWQETRVCGQQPVRTRGLPPAKWEFPGENAPSQALRWLQS